jgi:hypothetical protein
MKLRFFGDSWCWVWIDFDQGPIPPIQSKKLASAMASDHKGIPMLNWYFNSLGIETEIVAYPGRTLRNVADTIVTSVDNSGVDYNIVFVSSPYRYEQVLELDTENYDKFIEQWNTEILLNLNAVQKWAEQNNQIVFLVGGQTTLQEQLFNSMESTKNVYLLSECVVSDVMQLDPKFGIFKVADFANLVNSKFCKELVDHIYNDMNYYAPNMYRDRFTWPDANHLGPTGTILLVDLILAKIEEIEGEKE